MDLGGNIPASLYPWAYAVLYLLPGWLRIGINDGHQGCSGTGRRTDPTCCIHPSVPDSTSSLFDVFLDFIPSSSTARGGFDLQENGSRVLI